MKREKDNLKTNKRGTERKSKKNGIERKRKLINKNAMKKLENENERQQQKEKKIKQTIDCERKKGTEEVRQTTFIEGEKVIKFIPPGANPIKLLRP